MLASIDVAHSIFVLVSKSGTTLETLTNEAFVKNALTSAGLDPSKHMVAVTSEDFTTLRAMRTVSILSIWMTLSEEDIPLHQLLVA